MWFQKEATKGKPWDDAFEVVVNFEINLPEGFRILRPYVAVWIEDKDGYSVRTLALWYQLGRGVRWLRNLRRWTGSERVRRRSPAIRGFLLLALASFLACHRPATEQEGGEKGKKPKREEGVVELSPEAVAAARIETAVVSARAGLVRRHATGSIEPDATRTQDVKATAAGRVLDVRVKPGDRVRAGDLLASYASSDSADAHGKLRAAEARARLAQANLRRAEALAPLGAIAGKELAAARAEAEQADAEVEQAKATLRALGAVDGRASSILVSAPASGTVTKRFVNPGETVETGEALLTVADLTTVWAVANVPESMASEVVAGIPAEVHSTHAEAPIGRGRVAYVDPMLDPELRAARARIELPNPEGRLKLGMFIDVLRAPRPRQGARRPRGIAREDRRADGRLRAR